MRNTTRYSLDYIYIDLEAEIHERVKIIVTRYSFTVGCTNEDLKEDLIYFLEYLDVALEEISEEGLSEILDKEFRMGEV